MHAVLLIAGRGKRLALPGPGRPKALVEIEGEALLLRLLRQLAAVGVARALLVVGYRTERVRAALAAQPGLPEIGFVHNPRFDVTNTGASVQLALASLDHIVEDIVICDGDLLLRDAGFLAGVVGAAAVNAIGVSLVAGQGVGEEEVKVTVTADTAPGELPAIRQIGKWIEPRVTYGEATGLQRIAAATAAAYLQRFAQLPRARRDRVYYEDVFHELIERGHDFRAVPVAGDAWIEIDFPADLERARALAACWARKR